MTVLQFLFAVFASTTCLGAVMVALTQNIVRMAFWLMVSVASAAGLFFLLHADFLAAAQLLVYLGGTVVILVFGVMLTAGGRTRSLSPTGGETIVAAALALSLIMLLLFTVGSVDWERLNTIAKTGQVSPTAAQPKNEAEPQLTESSPTGDESSPVLGAGRKGDTGHALGSAMIGFRPQWNRENQLVLGTGYLLPFEIISVHLLVVLIGAAYLARAKRQLPSSRRSPDATSTSLLWDQDSAQLDSSGSANPALSQSSPVRDDLSRSQNLVSGTGFSMFTSDPQSPNSGEVS